LVRVVDLGPDARVIPIPRQPPRAWPLLADAQAISAITPVTAATLRLIAYFPIESKRISRAALASHQA
jgi:hypothetical protein